MKPLKIIHLTLLILAILFSLFIGSVALENYIDGQIELSIGRIISSLLLLSYSIVHINLYKKASTLNIMLFLILYIAMGLTAEFFSLGLRKNWAPYTQEEAFWANVEWVLISATLIVSSLFNIKNIKK